VSDLHLNPLGAELVVRLAGDLKVDAVLDTGDVTTFGLPVESRFGALLEEAPVPYLLVPGNHDSPENRRQLAALDGIRVLDGDVVTIGGVRILGIADPTFTASNEVSTQEANDVKASLTDEVRSEVLADRPDLLAVHDPAQAADTIGVVPVVVAGHLHQRTQRHEDGTWVFTIGSTGATGLGAFTVETQRPYDAEVLRFRDGELVAVDHISVSGIDGAFTLERQLIEPSPQRAPSNDDVPGPRQALTTTTTAAG
jgi:predicted phosphodiesterase